MATDNRAVLVRANRVTVQPTEQGWEARFFRTHKQIAVVRSEETSFMANTSANKTAQREQYRDWVCMNAEGFGVEWKPDDLRDAAYAMPNRYENDEMLKTWAVKILEPDIKKWMEDVKVPTIKSVVAEEITPVTKSPKGADVSPKYNNGCWAWAQISVVVTWESGDTEGYVTMVVSLVSGQLKKPTKIGDGSYTKTGFLAEIAKDLPKAEETEEKPSEEPPVIEPEKIEKPKRGGRKSKKDQKDTE